MTPIRLVNQEGQTLQGRVMRVTPVKVFVQCPEGFQHVCNRDSGRPFGPRYSLTIHPEDIALLDGIENTPVPKRDPRRGTGTPPNWNV